MFNPESDRSDCRIVICDRQTDDSLRQLDASEVQKVDGGWRNITLPMKFLVAEYAKAGLGY